MEIQLYSTASIVDDGQLESAVCVVMRAVMSSRDIDGTLLQESLEEIELKQLRGQPWWGTRLGARVAISVTSTNDWSGVTMRRRKSMAEDALLQLFPNECCDVNIRLSGESPNAETDEDTFELLQKLVDATVDSLSAFLEGERIPATSGLWSILS